MISEPFISIDNHLSDLEPLLLVDDSATARRIIRNLLNQIGIKDIIEMDNLSGLATLPTRQFRFIICDVEMSPINGIQFVSALKQDPELSKVPVLLVTGSRNISYARSAKHLKISGLLLKPFNAMSLLRAIKHTKVSLR